MILLPLRGRVRGRGRACKPIRNEVLYCMTVDKECFLGEALNILAPHQKDFFSPSKPSASYSTCQTVIVNFM